MMRALKICRLEQWMLGWADQHQYQHRRSGTAIGVLDAGLKNIIPTSTGLVKTFERKDVVPLKISTLQDQSVRGVQPPDCCYVKLRLTYFIHWPLFHQEP